MKKVCLGGTFDHLHAGHKRLIDAAIAHCYDQDSTCIIRSLTIGVSEDELLKGKAYAEFIQDYDTRVRAIRQYVITNAPEINLEIFALKDANGPLLSDKEIDYLVCSDEQKVQQRAYQIAQQRQQLQNFPDLLIDIVPCLATDGLNEKLSSTQIRKQLAEDAARKKLEHHCLFMLSSFFSKQTYGCLLLCIGLSTGCAFTAIFMPSLIIYGAACGALIGGSLGFFIDSTLTNSTDKKADDLPLVSPV